MSTDARSEREVEQYRALLETVITQSPVPMALISCPDMVIRLYNKACREILGHTGMPDLTGRELYQKLTEDRRELKVLFMSGYTENVIAHHGVLEPGTAFVQKPFSAETLVRRVRQVLDGEPSKRG